MWKICGIDLTTFQKLSNLQHLQDLNYIYDAVGNIVEMNDAAQQSFFFSNTVIDPVGQYWYDPLYRLVKATGRELTNLAVPTATDFAGITPIPDSGTMQNYTHNYTYDAIGNIQQLQAVGNWTKNYYYDSNNYLLKHIQNQTLPDYTYDAHGNMLTMPHLQSMTWNFKDQLSQVVLNTQGDTAYYIYDNTGNRVRKVIEKGSIREERYYVGGYEVYRKFVSGDLDFERQTLHVDDDKSKVALIETKTVEDGDPVSPLEITIRYQYSNHLGTACLELDDTADIISYEEYHPFGTTSYRSGRNQVDVSLKRYKYVGKERDEETGLYYYGARYYADWLCRFVSVDPLQFKYPYYTPYQYAGNKPISYIDLDGMEEEKKTYDVKKGDSPSQIAANNGMALDQLAKANPDIFKNYDPNNKDYWSWGNRANWTINPGNVLNITASNYSNYIFAPDGTSNYYPTAKLPQVKYNVGNYSTEQNNVGFTTFTGQIGYSALLGYEAGFTRFTIGNANQIWSNNYLTVGYKSNTQGLYASANLNVGIGSINNVNKWADMRKLLPKLVLEANSYSASYSIASASYSGGSIDSTSINYIQIGVGPGLGGKYIPKKSFGYSGTFYVGLINYEHIPSIEDSIKTALSPPLDSLSKKVLSRYPHIPK